MKIILVIFIASLVSGCQSIMKDIFEIAATPEELSKMSVIDVCKNYGYAQWRNQPQAYLDAKNEALKRIKKNEVDADDCSQFSQMAIRKKEASKEASKEQMYRAEDIRKQHEY